MVRKSPTALLVSITSGLVEERRSEFNPSGLLVAEYSEKQMVGERDNGLEQKSELDK